MIVVTGSLAFDYIFNFPGRFGDHIMPEKIHEINLSFIVDKFEKRFGGTAGNIAYNLSLLGIKPAIFSAVGQDFGQYKKRLIKYGVNVKYLKVIKNENSSVGFVMNDLADNQIWGYSYGALRHGKNMSMAAIKEPIEMFIISATEISTFNSFTQQAIKNYTPYLYDFGMLLASIDRKDLIQGVINARIIVGNDYEIALMHKKTGLTKKEIIKKGKILITTLAEKGSVIETNKERFIIPAAKPKKVLDPTGAGDAYRAGFVAGWFEGRDLEVCGRMGAVASVYAVEKYGTQEHHFTKKEFCDRFEKNFGEELALE